MKLNSEKCKTILVPTARCLREAAERASPSELPVALGVIAVLLDAGDVPEDAWAEPLVEAQREGGKISKIRSKFVARY